MSIQTETSYSALEHTITVDGGWPVCASCGEPGSHEACVADEHQVDQVIRGRVAHRRPPRLGARARADRVRVCQTPFENTTPEAGDEQQEGS